jgi:AAA15 family ATPase/GTPase
MKITEIQIKKFRNISGINISFSERLNAIAGQNGTSKTSILGLIGHIFTFDKEFKTLSGKNFSTEFSEIFKFSYPKYDKAGSHNWITKFKTFEDVPAISYDRIELNKEKGIRIRVRKSTKKIEGGGKIEFPVIYLGMGRLFPLALEDTIKSNNSELTDKEIKEFVDLHNEILMIMDENIKPESITSSKKSFYAISSDKYNHLGNSAGQDNIGQIITAIISFKRLQKEMGDKYKGGILLIDELDASLFPAAQIKLVEKLYKKSLELNLQIFYTTHSLEVLSETRNKQDSQVVYLDKNTGSIVPKYNLDIEDLKKDLLVLGPDAIKNIQNKKYIYCEDEEALEMLNSILVKENKDLVKIFPTKLGANVLVDIAKKNIPDFKYSIIVLDGDQRSNIKNVLSLPGVYGPDRLIYNFLFSLDPSKFNLIKNGYTKQFCFKNLVSLDTTTDDTKTREKVKKWYKEQKSNWGRSSNKVWKLWAKENEESIDKFNVEFRKLI